MTQSSSLTYEATLHRTRLLLGLSAGVNVVAWADARLMDMTNPPPALLDLLLTPPSDLSALRLALLPLSQEPIGHSVLQRVAHDVAADLLDGRRSVTDTVEVLRQMRRMLPIATLQNAELDTLTEMLMLAEAGIGVSGESADDAVVVWAKNTRPDHTGW